MSPAPASRRLDRLRRLRRRLESGGGAEGFRAALQDFVPYLDLRDELYRQVSFSRGAALEGTLRLGFRCNQRCRFCWQGRRWPEAPAERYQGWLEEMAEQGI